MDQNFAIQVNQEGKFANCGILFFEEASYSTS